MSMPEDTRAHIRARSLRAGALLSDALGKVVDYDTIPRTAHGKPYIPGEPDFHFSISHSGNYLLLAICRTHEIGADLQEIRPVKPGIDAVASRFFSRRECLSQKNHGPRRKGTDLFQAVVREGSLSEISRHRTCRESRRI